LREIAQQSDSESHTKIKFANNYRCFAVTAQPLLNRSIVLTSKVIWVLLVLIALIAGVVSAIVIVVSTTPK